MKYTKPHFGGDEDKLGESDWVWEVFSVQDKNQTFTTPGGTKVKETINYLDWFFVMEQQGEYIHIYKDDKFAEHDGKPGPKSKDFGWIHQDHLLLWKSCLYNSQDVSSKAVLLNTIKYAKSKLEKGETKKVRFYKDPDMKIKTDYECNIFEVFYIYKVNYFPNSTRPVSYLLGSTHRFSNYSDRENVKGWVDARRVTVWDHRVAALPNTSPEAISERKTANVKATVFNSSDAALRYREKQPLLRTDLRVWDNDSLKTQEQYKAYFNRFPILSSQKELEKANQVIRIGTIGEVQSISGDKMNEYQWSNISEKMNEGSVQNRNINLIFVIDGTQSMQPFFTGVSEGINESMKELSTDKKNHFNFAVMIYRDKEDKQDVTEYHPLTDDFSKVSSWLSSRKARSSADDPDFAEAMFNGLKSALRRTSPPEKETNVVILVGDAGDNGRAIDDKPVSTKEIIDLMYQYKCNFLAFQVNNPGTEFYVKFISQTRSILNNLAGQLYTDNKKTAQSIGTTIQPPILPDKMDLKGKYILQNSPLKVGFIMQSPLSKGPITQGTLTKEIVQALYGINDSTNVVLADAQKMQEGAGVDKMSGALITYLTTLDIPAENLKILADEHAQLYNEGYTPVNLKNLQHPLWQNDLLFSNDEFSSLIGQINKLSIENSPTNFELRKAFFNAWQQLLKDHVGSISNKEIENMTLAEMEALVFGAVGSTPILSHKLQDINDPSLIPDQEFKTWVVQIDKKIKKLNKISNLIQGTDPYTFVSHDERFFWIPQSLLP